MLNSLNCEIINDSRTIGHLFEPDFFIKTKTEAISCDKLYKKIFSLSEFNNLKIDISSNATIIENLKIKSIYNENAETVYIKGLSFIINPDKSIYNVLADDLAQLEYLKNFFPNIKPFLIKPAIDQMDKQQFEFCDYVFRHNLEQRPEHEYGKIVKFIEQLYNIKHDFIPKLWSCNLIFEKIIFITDYNMIIPDQIYLDNNVDIPYYIIDKNKDLEYTFGKNNNEFYERRIGLNLLKEKIKKIFLQKNFLYPKKIYISRNKYNSNYAHKYFEIDRDIYTHGSQTKKDLNFNLISFSDNLKYDAGMRAITGPMSTWSRKNKEVQAINALYDSRYYHDERSLESLFKNKFNYEIIHLEKLSIQEQLNLFYNANHIVSFSSSALFNLIACEDSVNFYEISPWENSLEKFRIFGFKNISKENNFTTLYDNYHIISYYKDKNKYIKSQNIKKLFWIDADYHVIGESYNLIGNDKNE